MKITLRDYFAAHCLVMTSQTLLSTEEDAAEWSFLMADLMLKARKKKKFSLKTIRNAKIQERP